jgi:hypothetical protein
MVTHTANRGIGRGEEQASPPPTLGGYMPVEVTEHDGFYIIRYGIEELEWYDADSQAEMFRILAELAERSYIMLTMSAK